MIERTRSEAEQIRVVSKHHLVRGRRRGEAEEGSGGGDISTYSTPFGLGPVVSGGISKPFTTVFCKQLYRMRGRDERACQSWEPYCFVI